MKLAFCLFNYFPYGGLQRDFLRIARVCKSRGHIIQVYTMAWSGEREPDFEIHIIPVRGYQNHVRARQFACKLAAIFEKEKPDVIIGFNKMPGLDVYFAADVCYQSRVSGKYGLSWLPRYRQWIAFEKAVFSPKSKTEILLLSPLQQFEFMRFYSTEARRFHLLPPGISKDRLASVDSEIIRTQIRQSFSVAPNDFLLMMVGSGFKTKGLDRAILAFAALPEDLKKRSHFFIVGEDHAEPFKQLALQYGVSDRILFLGGRDDVPQLLLAADLLLHPAYHENTGTVLLEALASRLPVLTVDVCGYAHYIEEAQAGMVLASPFSQSLFNTTLQSMLHKDQLKNWSENGYNFAKEADIYSLPEKAADFIERINVHSSHQSKDYEINETIQPYFNLSKDLFDQLMNLKGEVFRHQKGRLTERIQLGSHHYFIKKHWGVGLKETIKNIFQGRLPVWGAKNEWRAIQALSALGLAVPKLIAFGERGNNPITRRSFVLMEEIAPAISLEDLSKTWEKTPPTFTFKQLLIRKVAHLTQTLHQHGINHRDLYLCHFLLDISLGLENIRADNITLYLIDLHRAELRRMTPERWIIKDLAGLYFSSKESGLTKRDYYRFMRLYSGKSLKAILSTQWNFWNKVKARGELLYHDHQ